MLRHSTPHSEARRGTKKTNLPNGMHPSLPRWAHQVPHMCHDGTSLNPGQRPRTRTKSRERLHCIGSPSLRCHFAPFAASAQVASEPSSGSWAVPHPARAGVDLNLAPARTLFPAATAPTSRRLPHHRPRHQLQHPPQPIIPAQTPFIKRRPRNRLPVISFMTNLRLRQSRERRIVLPIFPAQFVNH